MRAMTLVPMLLPWWRYLVQASRQTKHQRYTLDITEHHAEQVQKLADPPKRHNRLGNHLPQQQF